MTIENIKVIVKNLAKLNEKNALFSDWLTSAVLQEELKEVVKTAKWSPEKIKLTVHEMDNAALTEIVWQTSLILQLAERLEVKSSDPQIDQEKREDFEDLVLSLLEYIRIEKDLLEDEENQPELNTRQRLTEFFKKQLLTEAALNDKALHTLLIGVIEALSDANWFALPEKPRTRLGERMDILEATAERSLTGNSQETKRTIFYLMDGLQKDKEKFSKRYTDMVNYCAHYLSEVLPDQEGKIRTDFEQVFSLREMGPKNFELAFYLVDIYETEKKTKLKIELAQKLYRSVQENLA